MRLNNPLKTVLVFSLIVICMMAFSGGSKKEVIFTPLAPKPIGPYSQAIRSGPTLYVSGQIGLHIDGSLDTSSIENECKQALENIKAIVLAGEKQMRDVTKVTIYMCDLRNFTRINEIYKTYFPSEPPARETIEVKALPKGAHLEISVIAD